MNTLPSEQRHIDIVGSGPAGLSAAITVHKQDGAVTVYEKNQDVGSRFHGDFQGLENWTTSGNVLEELESMGINANFEHTPGRELVCFNSSGRDYRVGSSEPMYYLIRRGSDPGTLDHGLKEQALAAGTEIRFGEHCRHLERGGIVCEGPHRADAVAAGYLFETGMADCAFAALSEALAPKGYAYLLVNKGRGTVASCMFTDFHREREYIARTVDFFREHAGLRWHSAHRFGGSGNFELPSTARRAGLLYAGEAAGFQDALFGFGMRYALNSGHLAARALLDGTPDRYDSLWHSRMGGLLRAGVANRRIVNWLGRDTSYRLFLRFVVAGKDPRKQLNRIYQPGRLKDLLAGAPVHRRFGKSPDVKPGCDCTWCRCRHGDR